MADEQNPSKRRRDTILPERIMRRVMEGVGDVVDRKLGRTVDPRSGLTSDQLIGRMNRLIDERVREEKGKGRIAPHYLKLKVEWGTHSETPEEVTQRLETEIDIFTSGISVDPTFGEFEEDLRKQDLEKKLGKPIKAPTRESAVAIAARITLPDGSREVELSFEAGGRRLNVGRGTDNNLYLNHSSVSKIHAALKMDNLGTLLVADTGSTNGTHINGVRIPYGEARPISDGDVVAFGEVEVRFRRVDS